MRSFDSWKIWFEILGKAKLYTGDRKIINMNQVLFCCSIVSQRVAIDRLPLQIINYLSVNILGQ